MIKPITILLGDNGTGKTEYMLTVHKGYTRPCHVYDRLIDTRVMYYRLLKMNEIEFVKWLKENNHCIAPEGERYTGYEKASMPTSHIFMFNILTSFWKLYDDMQCEHYSFLKGSVFSVENPEICLSPSNQVLLTTLLVNTAKKANKKGLGLNLAIETHSEYVLDTIRALVAEDETDTMQDDVGILYFEVKDGEQVINELNINRFGVVDDWPDDFWWEQSELVGRILRARHRDE